MTADEEMKIPKKRKKEKRYVVRWTNGVLTTKSILRRVIVKDKAKNDRRKIKREKKTGALLHV